MFNPIHKIVFYALAQAGYKILEFTLLIIVLSIISFVLSYIGGYIYNKARKYKFKHLFLREYFVYLIAPLALSAIIIGFYYWFNNRPAYTEIQSYIFLSFVAFYLALLFGLIDFILYIDDREHFEVDEKLILAEKEKEVKRLEAQIKRVKDEIKMLENCIEYVSKKNIKGKKKKEKGLTFYTTEYTFGEISIDFTFDPEPPGLLFMGISFQGQECSIHRAALEDGSDVLFEYKNNPTSGKSLLNVLQYAIHTLNAEHLLFSEKRMEDIVSGKTFIPLNLFIYQSVLRLADSDPGYFKPASRLSRSVFVFFSFLKIIYLGAFLSYLIESFRK